MKTEKANTKLKFKDLMKEIRAITEWFQSQDELDVEEGIEKVKEGLLLIQEGKQRLAALENEFHEIKKSVRDSTRA